MALNAPHAAPSSCRALVPYVQQKAAAVAAAAMHDLVVTPHPLTLQGRTITRAARMRPGESLAGLLARHGVDVREPGWCIRVGGMEVPAALCQRTRVRAGMLIEAHRVPGKSVIRLVALIALAYFTLGAGLAAGGLGGYMGLTGFAAYAVNVGAFMLGSMVINKVLPPPGAGSYSGNQPGSTYSLQGARNGARPFAPLGLLFGQVRVSPDFAAQPYSWFEGDDQIQYVQLHAGLNVHTVEALQIGETAITSYEGVQVTRTGFASGNTTMLAWESVDSIAGGLLDAVTAPGAWVERTSSVNTVRLQIDLVGQVQYIDPKGKVQRTSLNIEAEYKLLPAGAWQPFVGGSSTVEIANSNTKPLRRTLTRDVAAGQYAVRLRKTTANATNLRLSNTVEWAVLKSYQADTGVALARQVVGIRIKASGQLNGTLDQVTWLATSTPCEVWTGSAWVTEATSNPGALLLQFLRGKFDVSGRLLWGYGKPDNQIDIEGLQAFMVHCAAQGYRFDHWFTEQISRRDVLEAIAAAGLASPSRHTGKLGVVYMASGQPIEAVVNMANIKRNTMRVDYNTRTTAEEVEVSSPERTNAFRPATLRVLGPGVTVPRETARVSPAGVTTQAGRLLAARTLMAQNIYGRKSVTWEMDLEHLTVRRWSVVALSHDLTQWGHGGRLRSFTDTAGTITIGLDAEVPAGSTPYVGLRLPGETAYRVFAVAAFTGTVHTLTLTGAWPGGVPQPGASADNPAMDTLWTFDFKATPGQRLRITDIAPTPDLSGARITAVPEPDEFWTFMASGAYTVPAGTATTQPIALGGLRVTQERLTLSYDLTAELAVQFTASGPYDHAQVWGAAGDDALQLLGQTRTTRYTGWRVVNTGTVRVEVRPFDALGRPGAVLAGTHNVVLDAPLVVQGNLLPVSELVPGLSVAGGSVAMVGAWGHNNGTIDAPAGPTSQLLMDVGPDGQPAVIWRSTSGTGGDHQGGFNRNPADAIDSTAAYRFASWVRFSGNSSGAFYLGCSDVETLAGVPDGNPYFFSEARNALVSGRWYLAVGYVSPAGTTGGGGLSGLWDAVTGQKVLGGVDYRWAPGALSCAWRSYQFYTTAAGAITDWAPPMVHKIDGTEPSVAALLVMSVNARVSVAQAAAVATAAADATAKANLAEVTAKAYADGIVTAEEARAIADATAKASAAQAAAITAAAVDATAKASAAQAAAQSAAAVDASAKANLAEVTSKAYADGIVTAEEARAIADATAKANAARVAAEAAAAADATAKANAAALTALWTGISGSGKPADNATVNRFTFATSAPGGAIDGDVWVDISAAPYVINMRVGGVWLAGANLSTGALAQLNAVDTAQIAGGAVHDIVVLFDADGHLESNAS